MARVGRLVSIIMPVYQTPRRILQRSIQSVLGQTYSNIELVIIDDGSSSKLANFLDEIAGKDKRIVCIHQENSGVSAARNVGIDESKGDYIAFMDADDVLKSSFVEESLSIAISNDLDAVYGTAVMVYSKMNREKRFCYPKNKIVVIEGASTRIVSDYFFGFRRDPSKTIPNNLLRTPFSKLFKKDVLREVRFISGLSVLEDAIFNAEVALRSSRIGLVDEVWYDYYQYEASACHGMSFNSDYYAHFRLIEPFRDRLGEAPQSYYSHCCYFFKMTAKAEVLRKGFDAYSAIKEALLFSPASEAFDAIRIEADRFSRAERILYRMYKHRLIALAILLYMIKIMKEPKLLNE